MESQPSIQPSEAPKPDVKAALRQLPPSQRVKSLMHVIVGYDDATRAESRLTKSADLFKEDAPLAHLGKSEDGKPSAVEQARAYKFNAEEGKPYDEKSESPHLEGVVKVIEGLSTEKDGKPLNEDAGDMLGILDQNLRICVVDDNGDYTGEEYTRTDWEAKVKSVTDPAEKAKLEQKGIWQLIPTKEDAQSIQRETDQIIKEEMTKLQERLEQPALDVKIRNELQGQLLLMQMAQAANGAPYSEAFKQDVLLSANKHGGAELSDAEKQYLANNIPHDKDQNAYSMTRALNEIAQIDPKLYEKIRKYPSMVEALQDRKVLLTKHAAKITEMFFGAGSRDTLQHLVDPHNFTALESYAKKGGIGILALLALIAFIGNAGINEMKSVSQAA